MLIATDTVKISGMVKPKSPALSPALSPQLQTILQVLTRAPRPLSAYDILDKLHDTGIKSPPTVYRALDKLAGMGLIHRLASLNAYVACCQHNKSTCGHDHSHEHNHDHDHVSQFAICTSCGRVQELESVKLTKLVRQASASFLENISNNVFEVTGTCHDCASAQ